ncbi:EAL domain-containing protein [Psychrobium sp. 1_MG-2023]|uniref:EAL domain-containing protein n=1 Tax=Psychrobium sp. 1_MG-2023 TaxID=3062624 RepID=UPI000C325B70|nr:EAL domain-containing protein [Psychrobium sp. 1_MG-2023]MDP2560189.1 EAL domain-containing protein [Psychrobium sp. 1_MG-2023]PKF57000.1 hypothetical protein CW748_07850 [Alteromonadales bacterium alter-6D02]
MYSTVSLDLPSNTIFQQLYQYYLEPVFVIQDGKFVYCNQATQSLFKLTDGLDRDNFRLGQLSPPFQPDGEPSNVKAQRMIEQCLSLGRFETDWLHVDSAHNLIPTRLDLRTVKLGNEIFIITIIKRNDDNQQHTSRSLLNQFNLLTQYKGAIDTSSIVSKADLNGLITYVNDNFCQASGYSREELLGKSHNIINHPDVPKSFFKQMWQTLRSGHVWQGVIENRRKDGSSYFVESTITPIVDINGNTCEYIAIRNDLTCSYQKDKTIFFQNTDSVTNLPNRNKFFHDITQSPQSHLAIIEVPELIDIHHVYPEQEYQQLMLALTNILTAKKPQHMTCYRGNENQFFVSANAKIAFSELEKFCRTIATLFEKQFIKTLDNKYSLSLFIGLANNIKSGRIYTKASMALTSAKQENCTIKQYQSDNKIQQQLTQTISWVNKLRHAILKENIVIFGQHLVERDGSHYSTEVLMRYYDPQSNSYISPTEFLKHAKTAKIYPQLSQIVIEQAFAFFSQTQSRFSINLTQSDIDDNHVSQFFLDKVAQYQLGERVIIEIVESESLDLESESLANFLSKAKEYGCKIAIDDFGSGYSNFEYLTVLPIDLIKIDGSLVRNIHQNEKHLLIVRTIVEFCHALGIKVVAEYITDREVFETVYSLGVDYYQGYHFHKPVALS